MHRFVCPLALLCCALVTPAAAADSAPTLPFQRVMLLDVSTSMVGENIRIAKEEILEHARQFPPSDAFPLIILPFHTKVDHVYRFTDFPALEAYLSQLVPYGGTSIAGGLHAAFEELSRHADCRHTCLFLYTDGEDPEQDEIQVEEQRLNQLFSERQKQGLKQTVVFCKRWGNANAQLVSAIRKHGQARVIDAGELKLTPLILEPRFQVMQVRWASDDPTILEATVAAQINAQGSQAEKVPIAPVRVRCLHPGAQGKVSVDLTPGNSPARALKLRLPLDVRTLGTTRRIEVPFQIADPRHIQTDTALFLPFLPCDIVRLGIDLPPLHVRSVITATLSHPAPARWTDPAARRASVPLTLTLDVKAASPHPWAQPIEFRITPAPENRILSGTPTCTLAGPGTREITIAVEAVPGSDGRTLPISLTLAPVTPGSLQQFQPSEVIVKTAPPTPPLVITSIRIRPLSTTPPRWLHVATSLAAFSAKLDVQVDGPLLADTVIMLRSPLCVRKLRIDPAKLRSGTQTVTLHIEAQLRPAPARTPFAFHVELPASQGAVTLQPPQPWQFDVTGPPAPRLALSVGATAPPTLDVSMSDTESDALLSVTPVLLGLTDPQAGKGLSTTIRSSGGLRLEENPRGTIARPLTLRLTPTDTVSRSFFRDTRIEGDLVTAPAGPDSIALASRQHVVVRVEAPFKRLLFYLVGGISLLLAVALIVTLVHRFTTVDFPRR